MAVEVTLAISAVVPSQGGGAQRIRHRSSPEAMGVHAGGFMAKGQAPLAAAPAMAMLRAKGAFCQPGLACRLQPGPLSSRVISATCRWA